MTDRIMRWLDESQRLADQATEGPWEYMTNETPDGENLYFTIEDSEQGSVAETNGSYQGRADAEFIAEARTRFPQAVAALKAIKGLHRPCRDAHGWTPCRECEQPWPCLTVQELDATLGLEGDQE